ncbi:hypothetical protein BDN71DRAFT_1459204 [Pleurotus eryngii]|uniref:Uncharacterized protein n=1 Tax=Pleurotus eryngii TaxID=5323 RepID=A0A9P5ZFS6_PLEER|nr:hypothetical protein BDN71DRAFT_1459204 [Pleurotus eryngii]
MLRGLFASWRMQLPIHYHSSLLSQLQCPVTTVVIIFAIYAPADPATTDGYHPSLLHLFTDVCRLLGNGLLGMGSVVLLRLSQYLPSSFATLQGIHLLANSSLPRIPFMTSPSVSQVGILMC